MRIGTMFVLETVVRGVAMVECEFPVDPRLWVASATSVLLGNR